jgi:Phage tail sheath protein subtilisin-like domain/Phage tail sheath C-terminal domain
MALNLVSPGVKIREVDLTVGGITAANNQVGAIAGPFQKGPVNVPILIETENDLLNTFGKPISSDAQYEYWLGASSYLSYGGVLRVVRCDGTNLNNANSTGIGSTTGTTLKIKSTEDYNNNYSTATGWAWAARNPGSWANNLKVCVIDAAADQRIAIGSFGLTVGYAVTAAFSQSVAGVGTVTTETGVLKGIITKVNEGSIDVKVTAKSSGAGSTAFTATSYSEGSVSAFGAANIKITDNTGSFVKIEELSVSRFYGVVSAGSTVINPVDATTSLPSNITPGQFIVPVTGSSLADGTTYTVGIATTINGGVTQTALGLSVAATGSGTVQFAVLNVAANGETITAPSDWYNQQTLGLTNSTVYWRNIAPRPKTSEYASQRNAANDEIHVVVIDDTGAVTGTAGNIVEKYTNLSKASDAKISPSEAIYYKDIIAENSQYIFPGFAPTGADTKFSTVSGVGSATDTTWGLTAQGNTFNCIGAAIYNLTGGTDYSGTNNVGGYSSSLADVISGYRNFTNPAEYQINFIIGGPSGGTTIQESQAKANELIAIAENRKDCVATISPYRAGIVNVANSDTQTTNIVNFFDPLTSSSYAVFDTGYKYVYDRFNNQFRYVACSADVAGLMARTSINQYPWFSPAGANRGALNNAVKLAYNPSQAQRDLLYPKRINPIIFSPGAGIILFGDKTALSYTSAFDRINVRRLFLTLESSIERAARAQLFEFNDTITRANFINIVEPYLRDVKSKRGITDFVVVCDESNNTPDVIDGNQFKADIYIKPARSINFIGLTFVATRTGVSFEEIIGTV